MLTTAAKSAIQDLYITMLRASLEGDAETVGRVTAMRFFLRDLIAKHGDEFKGVIVLEALSVIREILDEK